MHQNSSLTKGVQVHSDITKTSVAICIHFIKVTSSDWLLPVRYMKMGHQMMESIILRMTGRLGMTFALYILMHVILPARAVV